MLTINVDNGVPEMNPEEIKPLLNSMKLIDVRTKEEYFGELSHIAESKLVTLGEVLTQYLKSGDRNQQLLFICKSGGRSGKAALEAMSLGYKFVVNVRGGMMRWNELKYPVVI